MRRAASFKSLEGGGARRALCKRLRLLWIPFVLFGAPAMGVLGDLPPGTPLTPSLNEDRDMVEQMERLWMWESLDSALQFGLLGIAEQMTGAIGQSELDLNERERLLNVQLRIALIQGDSSKAEAILSRLGDEQLTPDPLLEGLLAYSLGNMGLAEAALRAAENQVGDAEQRAWVTLLDALLLQASEGGAAAREAFGMALDAAPTPYLREQFELIRLRRTLLEGGMGPDGISALRESVRSMAGERAGFEAARLLAIGLSQSGNTSAAIEVLGSHLAMPDIREFGLRSDFLLLLAVISGPGSARGRLALEQLIGEAENSANVALAFSLYATHLMTAGQGELFLAALDEWIAMSPVHPLIDRLLLEKAFVLLQRDQLEAAGASAQRLIEQFPNSIYRANALRALAQVAWRRSPPAYRTAADYLNQLRLTIRPDASTARVSMLMADCFFLNGDYRRAAEVYSSVLTLNPVEFRDQANFQRILSEIGAGRFEEAASILDAAYESDLYDENTLWKAEWNLVDAMRKRGQLEAAFSRVEKRLDPATYGAVVQSLALRMEWLGARLNVDLGYADAGLRRVEKALAQLPQASLPAELKSALESNLLLVGGEAAYLLNDDQTAAVYFGRLRETFPDSGPDILSYLIESRQQSAEDNLVSAQQSLIALVDRFPASEYAPIALWEAALNAQQRGQTSNFQEAITILERLITAYPENGLVFYARLKQGDLARVLNDFPTALALYEDLLSKFANHPEIVRAHMNRADCLMAMGSADPARYDSAAVTYERTFLLRDVPHAVRVEAGYKWAQSLERTGEEGGKERVLWMLCQKFCFDDSRVSEVGEGSGDYWLSRSLLELAEIQESKAMLASARRLYETMVRMKLPGSLLAASRLRALE